MVESHFTSKWRLYLKHSVSQIPPKQADGIIVGAGIVGLACAYQIHLKYPTQQLIIVDKESGPAQHQTGHNSGVLHSGIYYPPHSQKAENCLLGKSLMEEFCEKESIPYERCGKVIVAKDTSELDRLNFLFDRGLQHGLDLELFDKEALLEREPHVKGVKAIHVKASGIVDYKMVCQRLLEILLESGKHQFIPNYKVTEVEQRKDGVQLNSGSQILSSKWAINATGLYSDKLYQFSKSPSLDYRIIPFRGEYYKLKVHKRHLCQHLIYPVPDPSFPFLGVHLTRMINGEVECGPNAVLALAREGYTWSDINLRELWECLYYPGFHKLAKQHYKAGLNEMKRSLFKSAFTKSLQELVPELTEYDIEKAPAGIRAQALEVNGKLMDDFHFLPEKPWLHLCNVPSPAATSSLNIGKVAMGKLEAMGCLISNN